MTSRATKLSERTRSDPRWAAVVGRDRSADGRFFYAVESTGVYCRPSCGARTPRPENVGFFSTSAEAERAGFRPCKRCKPDQPSRSAARARLVADLCRHIEASDPPPTLAELAARAGMSRHHLLRTFQDVTGLTPKQYGLASRAERARAALARGSSVTAAIYAAGYGSSGRFYEASRRALGMQPAAYRAGGDQQVVRFAVGACSLGSILVAATERGVCAISLGDQPDALMRELQDRFPHAELIGDDRQFSRIVATVVGFVEAPERGLDLPLDLRGTAFQRRVWQALQRIPFGATRSYREIAERIGAPRAVRAVAGACAANTLAVAIPCHRVVRTDGALTGYRWGIERKRALLDREARGTARPIDGKDRGPLRPSAERPVARRSRR